MTDHKESKEEASKEESKSGCPFGHDATIKEAYSQIKSDTKGKVSGDYMQNVKNQLRLVFWETTAGCNLECIHCRRLDVSKELTDDDMTTEESFKFIDELSATMRPILILSGGEPLYRPDIFKIARYAVDKGLKVALATNGTLVDEGKAREIKNAGVERVSISIDGSNAETHDSFRKIKGSFDGAIRGFKNLKKVGMSVQINCTIANHNVDEFEDIYELALSLGSVALHVFMLVPVGCGVQIAEDQMLEPARYEAVLNTLYDKAKESKMHIKATCAPHYFRIMRERAKKEGVTISPKTHGMAAMTKGCLAGTAVCFVSHKGEVFPCGYLPVNSGNVKTENINDIWESSAVFTDLRDPALLEGKCGVCEYKKVCAGCRARAFYETENYLAEEPYCVYQPKNKV
ncbi:MAG: radical SAM protein [Candidatus Anammoxibacter sp.]